MKQDEKTKNDTKNIAGVVESINKDYGDGSAVVGIGSNKITLSRDAISTRCLSLDTALGIGGVPRGRIIEIYGSEGAGKTTLALEIVAEAQSKGGGAAYIDVENACDPEYMRNIGVDIDKLVFSQPNSAEEAFGILEREIDSGCFSVIVVDSVAALSPQSEIDAEVSDLSVAPIARLMSSVLRKLTAKINKTKTCVIFINQVREKVSFFSRGQGPNEVSTGGRALKFYASIRMEIKKTTQIVAGTGVEKVILGHNAIVKIVKSKVSPPFKTAKMMIFPGEGISTAGSILELAINYHIVDKSSGGWINYGEVKLGQGMMEAIKFLKKNPKTMSELTDTILRRIVDSPERIVDSPEIDNKSIEEDEEKEDI